ncbi:MAG: hypothetical protein ABI617_01955 [Sphingomicrobium sp.]
MPYSKSHSDPWATNADLFAAFEGGPEVVSWFGFIPDFHDAKVRRMEFLAGAGVIEIDAFRMTSEVDERGYFRLDRHALVSLNLSGVTGVIMSCDPNPGIEELGIRRLNSKVDIPANIAALVGDLEIAFDDVCGGSGLIFARSISLTVTPAHLPLPEP